MEIDLSSSSRLLTLLCLTSNLYLSSKNISCSESSKSARLFNIRKPQIKSQASPLISLAYCAATYKG